MCVIRGSLELLEESVKRCEELKLLSEMTARKKKTGQGRKAYERVWSDLIQSVTLKELSNYKRLDKYMDYRQILRKHFTKSYDE